jgi:hypothetical protein
MNMLTWLKNNWLMCLTVMAAVNTLLSPIAEKVPPTTWYGKILHVVVAISPMDIMKAMKAIGAAAVPPMGTMLLLLAMCFGLGTSGCSLFQSSSGASSPSSGVDVRAMADASVQLLEVAWEDAGTACLDAARAAKDDTIRQKCEVVLTPARTSLIAAQSGLDAWAAGDQKNVPCLIASVANSLASLANVVHLKLPQSVVDGVKIAESYVGQCGGAS